MKKLLLVFLICASAAFGQTTTTYTGVIKDLTGSVVTSGQVEFTLMPGIDTSMSGIARFSSVPVDCGIDGSGNVKNLALSGACVITNNTAQQPSGTSYKVCMQPQFISPGSCFVTYATGGTVDITQQIPTPPLTPAYNLVDTFSNQTINGNKVFGGNISFSSGLTFGNFTASGTFTANNGGALGGTFTGNPTFSGTPVFSSVPTFNSGIGSVSAGSITATEIVSSDYFCPIIDNTGLTDISATSQSCFNTAFTNGEKLRFAKGKFLFSTAQNWTNKPGFKVECSGSQYQISSQSPIAGAGTTIFLGNTGGVLLDTTGSGDQSIKNCTIYLGGTGITTPSTVGIRQGRDNTGGGGSSNPFCFAQKFHYDNVNIIDFTNNTSANTSRGYVGIYNVGAENGWYTNMGIHSGTPIVLAATDILSIPSPFQPATGCPASMTQVHMDTVLTDAFTSATPNIEASGTFSVWLTNHQFQGGNATILFEGATTSNWHVTGAQESAIATSYAIRSTVNVNDSYFHIEALPSTAMINPEANNLTFANNLFEFNSDNTTVPLITNTATGTAIKGGFAVVSGTTTAANTTVTGTDVFAPGVTDGNITFNAASLYEYKGTSGLITHGTRKATQFLATSNGTCANPAFGLTSSSTGYFLNTNTQWQLCYGSTPIVSFNGVAQNFPVSYILGWSSNADPNNAGNDTGISRSAADVLAVGNGTAADSSGTIKARVFLAGGAASTLSGTGACATITTQTGGSSAGRATCTGTTGASTLTITPGTTATNGWVCYVQDQTTRANLLQQTSNSTTACTLTATSVTQNDVFVFTAIAF